MACSQRRHGQDKTVLSCPRRRCEQAIMLQIGNLVEARQKSSKLGRDKTNRLVSGVNKLLENVAMMSLQQQCQMSRRSLTEQRHVAVAAVKLTSFDSNNTYKIV